MLPSHFAPGGGYEFRGVALQCVAERVVGGDEEPGIAARFHHGPAGRLRQHGGVVGPVDGVGVALRAGQIGRCGAGIHINLVPVLGDAGDRQADARIRAVEDDVDAVAVVPLPCDAGADIGLVEMVG